ncbi:hypothetical protein PRZ48_002506 [Zasmidium cellare]|uniref:C6 transcription factor n=1 Tax=Zasmidium cellare TaxID=395010 RepID=A0ABR0F486_ZASCE|nr:hypothetical protein PRZ48_002506 [Zasmidium cellare]
MATSEDEYELRVFKPRKSHTKSRNGCLASDTLAATELDLLARYLTHTSHIIPVDDVDVYALQVGIPNLAFASQPLMNSVLALAAVCRCHEILKLPHLTWSDWRQLEDLLALANSRYESSLRQIQDISCASNQDDCILANATLMVLYGSASHSLRIRLAEPSRPHGHLSMDLAPAPLQWTYLIRAAHLAYTGLLHCNSHDSDVDSIDEPELPITSTAAVSPDSGYDERSVESALVAPMETMGLMQSIITATSKVALAELAGRLQTASDADELAPSTLSCCTKAFTVLCSIFNVVTSAKHQTLRGEVNSPRIPQKSRLAAVSPWLRTYVARVTSAVPQKQLRRIITSFLNRVPMEFLELVHESVDDPMTEYGCTAASQIALDIFAHWLVLVTLLEDVWWIGGIGEWELERTVNRFKELHSDFGIECSWWPERMLEIRRVPLDDGEMTSVR